MIRPGPALSVHVRPVSNGVERRRVLEWFDATSDAAVRILCGPIGSGKTFAARQFVAASDGRAAYVRVALRTGADRLRAMIATSPAETVVLDEIDRIDATAYADLLDAIVAGELERKIVLIGRSRRRLRAESLIARGLARVCGDEALAFDADELERLAAANGIEADPQDLAQLLHDTDGWPLASEWLVRDAAENRRALRDAFTHWQQRNGHLLLEFVEREGFEDAAAYETFFGALRSGWPGAQHESTRLEQLGLPIVRTRSGLRPYRILARLAAPAVAAAIPEERHTTTLPPLMAVNVFGRFRCEIGGRPVPFSRRRDQQVFAFVVLQPECRTTRERLLEAFWPGLNHAVASQGLRTTLSRIRRAIAEVAPSIDPERYFETAGEVRVNVRTVAIDVHRFMDRVEQGRLDDARGAVEGAKHHYRVARRIYADRVLAAEAPEPCLHRHAEQFEAVYVEVLTRITELHAATGDFEVAREAARALLSCNSEDARRRALTCIALRPAASATA